MTTINGKNKTERLINKAKKYVNVDLRSTSNKYFVAATDDKNVLVADKGTWSIKKTRYGVKYLIEPNNLEKPFWIAHFAVVEGSLGQLIFKPWKMTDEIEKCLIGRDGLYRLTELNEVQYGSQKVDKKWSNYQDVKNLDYL